MLLMHDYSGPEYKDLYEEILKDYYYRFPKYSPIPYPLLCNDLHEKKNNPRAIRKRH